MIRCKLISPTNVLLSRPLLSPVDELEWQFIGVKELRKLRIHDRLFGFILGLVFALILAGISLVNR